MEGNEGSCKEESEVRRWGIWADSNPLGYVLESEDRRTELCTKMSISDKMSLAGLWDGLPSKNALSSMI